MRCFFSIFVLVLAGFAAMNSSYTSFKAIPIMTDWTCAGCWTTNSEDATVCKKCGRSR